MAVKVSFEIGHSAKLKSKKTPEGFTHDWELYVRGVDKIDISHFVDKVVFNLHDSFPKPKRTYKEAPYVLKESGYAGFVLPIDIYFKNRDDPKRVTYSYDLDLQNTGPPVHRSVVKKFIFNNPSDEFKQKLLKGGGVLLMMNYDEKSRDSTDERAQVSKPKTTIDPVKKHKIRPEDSKSQTFATLFGTPITKTSTKVSPDPKSKGSPGVIPNNKTAIKPAEKSAPLIASLGKDKIEKIEKKDKHRRNSPHKERDASKEDRKISGEEKRERKEEKSKEKSHSKDRDRSKDRALKRPASPKRVPSPKRPSPPRSSSTTSRGEEITVKQPVKNETDGKKVSSNSGKKSKKEKKSYEKDKDRERKERERERKDKEKDERSNSSNSHLSMASSNITHSGSAPVKGNADAKTDVAKKESAQVVKEAKEVKKVEAKVSENSNPEKKPPEKHDKDSEKKHKHKKKDKSKEKDKEKDVSAKEKKKEKINKQRDEIKKISQPSPQMNELILSSQQKTTPNSISTAPNKLSDQDTSDSENESSAPPPSEPKSNNNHSDASNGSFPDLMVQKPIVPHFEESSKPDKKEHKVRDKSKSEKDSKKRKRKSKDDPETFARKSVSPVVNSQQEPPGKLLKKDLDDKVNSPITSTSNQATPQDASPRISNSSPVFRTPSSAPVPVALSANNSSERNSINLDYMSELRELQHKIMTLQDNNELQQVVEMIAATGRFEVTSKTFDFDLCALDRTTVQRLQDFLATTVS